MLAFISCMWYVTTFFDCDLLLSVTKMEFSVESDVEPWRSCDCRAQSFTGNYWRQKQSFEHGVVAIEHTTLQRGTACTRRCPTKYLERRLLWIGRWHLYELGRVRDGVFRSSSSRVFQILAIFPFDTNVFGPGRWCVGFLPHVLSCRKKGRKVTSPIVPEPIESKAYIVPAKSTRGEETRCLRAKRFYGVTVIRRSQVTIDADNLEWSSQPPLTLIC
jgi:hypothetical protein